MRGLFTVASMTLTGPDSCRACRGRGRKSIRARKLVVVRTRQGALQGQRRVSCPFCHGHGVIAV